MIMNRGNWEENLPYEYYLIPAKDLAKLKEIELKLSVLSYPQTADLSDELEYIITNAVGLRENTYLHDIKER